MQTAVIHNKSKSNVGRIVYNQCQEQKCSENAYDTSCRMPPPALRVLPQPPGPPHISALWTPPEGNPWLRQAGQGTAFSPALLFQTSLCQALSHHCHVGPDGSDCFWSLSKVFFIFLPIGFHFGVFFLFFQPVPSVSEGVHPPGFRTINLLP